MVPKFLFINSSSLIQLLSSWLIHSLWAGLVLVVLVSLVILATRNAGARRRYNLMLASMAMFTLGMIVILLWQLRPLPSSIQTVEQTVMAGNYVKPVVITGGNYTDDLTDSLMSFTRDHSTTIVAVWLLFMVIRTIRLAGGLYRVHQLRHHHNEVAGKEWTEMLERLSTLLGINRRVALLRSHSVTVPLVIGHFKPVILLPFQLLTTLPASQIEAILLHELAHISRRDYLVNLLMNILETIFFFNPAVLWVASQIRKERENCCDDLTLAHIKQPAQYIEALISCQQLYDRAPMLATALLDKPPHLLTRVKRMLYKHNNRTLNKMEKSIISISLVTAVLLALAFTGKPVAGSVPANCAPEPQYNLTGTLGDFFTLENRMSAGHYFTSGSSDTLPPPPAKVPATPLPPASAPGAVPVPDPPTVPAAVSVPNPPTAPSVTTLSSLPAISPTVPPSTLSTLPPLPPTAPAPASSRPVVRPVAPATRSSKPSTSVPSPVTATDQANPVVAKVPPNSFKPANVNVNVNVTDNKMPVPAELKSSGPMAPTPSTEVDKNRDEFIREMQTDGLISNNLTNLSFKLSTKEFIINGKRQPAQVFEKYRKKYVKFSGNGDWSWYYNYDTDTVIR
ncbi:MAG: M56 family metallopeptidase [Chitinophagaceae bacterium]